MPLPFFTLAMVSPERQQAFRRIVVFHVLLLAGIGFAVHAMPSVPLANLGHALLVAGIVEGATLIGWRLVQLPKSQALEFLLVSALRPPRVFASEALVGLSRLALVTLAGLPLLLLMTWGGQIELADVPPLMLLPFLCGSVTGLGLAAWAYERRSVRRWGERAMIVLILVYLIVGVLAAERLSEWLTGLPWRVGEFLYSCIFVFSQFNPFGVLEYWLSRTRDPSLAAERMGIVCLIAFAVACAAMARAAGRFKGHFHDRHYRPITDDRRSEASRIGDRPLAWWAVRRVMEYAGRMNIYLAGGFGLLYAAYIVLGDAWPVWMGRMVFQIFENLGGVPALAAGLTVLAAVPAAFQYGLWDASPQDRCKRLELLLLTELDGWDYWDAALAAAWRRGRGYMMVALILWLAMAVAGRATPLQVLAAVAAGGVLWAFTFAVGFRAFSRGVSANGLGSLLTLGLPIMAAILIALRLPALAALLPPGAVVLALTDGPSLTWLPGPLLTAGLTFWLARHARQNCDTELRRWFDQNQGRMVLD